MAVCGGWRWTRLEAQAGLDEREEEGCHWRLRSSGRTARHHGSDWARPSPQRRLQLRRSHRSGRRVIITALQEEDGASKKEKRSSRRLPRQAEGEVEEIYEFFSGMGCISLLPVPTGRTDTQKPSMLDTKISLLTTTEAGHADREKNLKYPLSPPNHPLPHHPRSLKPPSRSSQSAISPTPPSSRCSPPSPPSTPPPSTAP